jgi:GAF domain-containing protein
MMIDDSTDRRLLTAPLDPEVHQRIARLRQLGLGDRPVREFDEFAARLANWARTPLAMVNFIGEDQQYFAGLFAGNSTNAGVLEAAQSSANASVSRVMARDHGYCPYVVVRRKALVLDDVCAYPRFSGNPVVDEIGIRSYIGAPLIDETGVALGTICAVADHTSDWGRAGLDTIKAMASELVDLIQRRR